MELEVPRQRIGTKRPPQCEAERKELRPQPQPRVRDREDEAAEGWQTKRLLVQEISLEDLRNQDSEIEQLGGSR